MADVRVISVREDARIGSSAWDKISWPIYWLADSNFGVKGRCGWEEFTKFWRTFSIIVIISMSVIRNLSLVGPGTFGVAGESMDEHYASDCQCEAEAGI